MAQFFIISFCGWFGFVCHEIDVQHFVSQPYWRVWFGLVWSLVSWFSFVWQAANLMWDDMQCSMGQHCSSWWVPLRVRQRMTEREPPLSSHRPYPSISQKSFQDFCLILTSADEMVSTKCEAQHGRGWASKYSHLTDHINFSEGFDWFFAGISYLKQRGVSYNVRHQLILCFRFLSD